MSTKSVNLFDFNAFDQRLDLTLKISGLDLIAEMATSGDDTLTGTNGSETLEGLDGDDTLFGLGGADILRGGDGRDTLIGGGNRDVLDGGRGADIADYSVHQQRVVADLADSSNNAFSALGDTFISIESLRGSQAGDSLRGDDRNNRLWGEDGDDRLFGRDGDDLLRGGDGNDMLAGGNGADRLFGDDGDDVLLAQDGDDMLSGGAGADTFIFFDGDGFDTISDFESGVDIIAFRNVDVCSFSFTTSDFAGGTRINYGTGNILIEGQTAATFVETDIRVEFMDGFYSLPVERVRGADPQWSGDDDDNLICVQGTGYSTASGGNGNDALISMENDTSLYGDDGDDILIGSDRSVFGGRGNDLYGGDGSDTLLGGVWNDYLSGGYDDSTDILHGGAGQDVLEAGPGADIIDGGEGQDLVELGRFTPGLIRGVHFELATLTLVSGGWSENTYISIEGVGGTLFDDRLFGSDGENRILGHDGADLIRGGGGDDKLLGGNGADILSGQNGDDLILGGSGRDRLNGGNGDDVLDGGTGDDTIFGGDGDDQFRASPGDDTFTGGQGADTFELAATFGGTATTTINDFESGVDSFLIRADDRRSGSSNISNVIEFDGDTYIDVEVIRGGNTANGTAIFLDTSAADLGLM